MVYYYDLTELIEILEDDGYLVYDSIEKFVDDNLDKVIRYIADKYRDKLVEILR